MYRYNIAIIFSLILLSVGNVFAQPNPFDLDQPAVINGEILVEANDAGEEISLNEEEYYAMAGQNFMVHLASFFNFKMSFSTVASYITPTLEQEFDVFIMINVAHENQFVNSHKIPAQHMKVLRRTKQGQAVFKRNAKGSVVGLSNKIAGNDNDGAFTGLSHLMPISSGAGHFPNDGQSYVDTPTGIYRINHSKSDVKRYSKGMWHSMYFDLVYPSGRVSGLAVHGTSKSQYKNLGGQRSHGCVRATQSQANVLYENLINDDSFWSNDLPDMNRRTRLKSEIRSGGSVKTRGGTRALIILFYGYDKGAEVKDV